jgi:hypothetical protein
MEKTFLNYVENALKDEYKLTIVKETNTVWRAKVYTAKGEFVIENFEIPKLIAYKGEKHFIKSSIELFEKSLKINRWEAANK